MSEKKRYIDPNSGAASQPGGAVIHRHPLTQPTAAATPAAPAEAPRSEPIKAAKRKKERVEAPAPVVEEPAAVVDEVPVEAPVEQVVEAPTEIAE